MTEAGQRTAEFLAVIIENAELRQQLTGACRKDFCRGKFCSQHGCTSVRWAVSTPSAGFSALNEAGHQAVIRHCNDLCGKDYFGR
ncbi:hypothetical protein DHODJN_00485 [Methylorubrum extorquens]